MTPPETAASDGRLVIIDSNVAVLFASAKGTVVCVSGPGPALTGRMRAAVSFHSLSKLWRFVPSWQDPVTQAVPGCNSM